MALGRRTLGWVAGLGLAVVGAGASMGGCSSFGGSAEGARLARMKASPRYGDDGFENFLPESPFSMWKVLKARFEAENTAPEHPVPTASRSPSDFDEPPASGLRVTWFGHSSFLVEIDGARILVDPVWGERASPFSWIGPNRFYPPALSLDELPEVDAVVISHDHYDHLDMPTVEGLRERVPKWVVPLGVGAHLERWGVPPERIVELDWWESHDVAEVKLHCTPARHFSGRGVTDRNATLWAGWALHGPEHRVFYSGDTALHPELVDIGERLGPFDLTLIECGAYSPLWRDVHLGPEQAVVAHQLVRGRVLLPVHWGLFDLANHGWTEPIQRVRAAALERGVELSVPRPGGRVEPTEGHFVDVWWDEEVPWSTAEETPQWSTFVEGLVAGADKAAPLEDPPASPAGGGAVGSSAAPAP